MSTKTPKQIASEHAGKVATYSDPNEETGLFEPLIESQAALTNIIEAAIVEDRTQQEANPSDDDDPHSLALQTSRTVRPTEIVDLVFGTGALTWAWWLDAHIVTRRKDNTGQSIDVHTLVECESIAEWYNPETTLVQLQHFSADDEDRFVTSWISFPQLVLAAAKVLSEWGNGDAQDMKTESLGYADAVLGDSILQHAVFGEPVYG